MSSQSVSAVEHLDEGIVDVINLHILGTIKIFRNVKDFIIGVLNLTPKVGVEGVEIHGCLVELVQCRGLEGRLAPRCASSEGVTHHRVCGDQSAHDRVHNHPARVLHTFRRNLA